MKSWFRPLAFVLSILEMWLFGVGYGIKTDQPPADPQPPVQTVRSIEGDNALAPSVLYAERMANTVQGYRSVASPQVTKEAEATVSYSALTQSALLTASRMRTSSANPVKLPANIVGCAAAVMSSAAAERVLVPLEAPLE